MRIIGLDIGSYSIKAVEIDSAFGRYEIREYYEQAVPAGQKPVQVAGMLLASLPKPPDRIVVALPGRRVTQRNLRIPTRDRKAIRSAVTFELEDDLPFGLDDSVYDYSVLSQGSQGSHVHISISLRKQASDFLAELLANGVDPDILTTEAWAYKTYLNRVLNKSTQDSPILLVQMGASQTTLYCHQEGYPLFTQTADWGGQDLTLAIAAECGLTPVEAERAKRERGLRVPGTAMDEIDRIECKGQIIAVLQKMLQEIRQAVLTCRNLTTQNPTQIFFSGGGSLVPGLPELISPEVHMPAQNLQALSAISLSGVSYSAQADAGLLLAAGLGLCLVGPDRANAINFRKGDLSKGSAGQAFDFNSLRQPILAFGAIAGCMTLSLVTESIVYKSKLKEENVRLDKSIRSFFPNLNSSAAKTYLSSPSKLKEAINKELQTQRELSLLYGANPHSPMKFLKALSSQVPTSVVVDMTDFQVGSSAETPYRQDTEGKASLTFLVSNAQMADKLAEILPRFLSDMQATPATETKAPDGTKKLKITFTGKPKESAYGK